VQRRTETYGLVRRRWVHRASVPGFSVISVAWQTWTGTPSASLPLTVGANPDRIVERGYSVPPLAARVVNVGGFLVLAHQP